MDAEGKPAEGATVVVERLRKPGDGKSDLPRRSDSMVAWSDVGPDEEQDWWEAIQELETKADADGGFVVHQHPTEAGYRLTAKAYPQKDVSQLITPGEQDIQLQLGAPSTVVGKVLLDRAIAKHGIQVQLRYPNDRLSRGYSSHGTVLYPDGSFRFNIERDAVVTLAAVAENSDEEFFLMEDLALDAEGGLHSIPDIDLRGALHQIVLSIEDENGIRLKEGQIGRPGAEDLEFFHAQPLILVSRSAAFDFEIQCDGWRKEVRTGVTSNERVVLRKGIPIQVQVTNLGILHEDWDLSTTILPADLDLDENQYHRDSVNLRLDADGVGNALVHSPGPYRVRYTILHARNKAPSTSWWHPVESNPDAPVLEILDLDETQQFLISIDPLLLEEAMRASDLKAAERLAEYEANQKRYTLHPRPMARLILPLLALATMIGLGILLIFGNGNPDPDSGEDLIDALKKQHGNIPREALEEVEMDPEQANRIERTDVETNADKGMESVSDYREPLSEGGILVSVVEGETDTPVPFADLMVLDSGVVDMNRIRAFLAGGVDFEWVLREFGVTYRTDDKGQVRIPEAVGFLALGGITDTLFEFVGQANVVDQAFTLRLKPIDLLRVKVVNEAGVAVAGVPVTIRNRQGSRSINTISSPTDADGSVSLKIFDGLKKEMGDRGETSVALMILSPEPIERSIDLNDLPKETVVLTAPATGRVEVVLQDDEGVPVAEDFSLQLSIHDPTEGDEIQPINEWGFDAMKLMASTKNTDGKATFDFVALGQEIRIRASSRDNTRLAMSDGTGPTDPGQTVTFTIVPAILHPVIIGTLIGPDGKRLAGRSIQVSFNDRDVSGRAWSSHIMDCDGQGAFRTAFEYAEILNGNYECRITTRDEAGEQSLSALVPLPSPLTRGVMDLGDVRMEVLPTLLAGRVVDRFGEPIHNAQVMLQKESTSLDPDVPGSWHSMFELHDRTEGDGTFLIEGIVSPGNYRVEVSHREFEPRTLGIVPGSEDLEIVLQSELRIIGKVLTDDWLDPLELQLLVRTPNEYGGHSTSFRPLESDGSFSFDAPDDSTGLAKISITADGGSLELFVLEDLDLASPETAQLLEVIDLRSLLHRITLTVRDGSGALVDHVGVRSGNTFVARGPGESVEVISGESSMDLEITADGHGVVNWENASGHHDVVLPSGYTISVQLENQSVVAEGWRVQGQLAVVSTNEGGNTHHMIIDSDLPMDGSPVVVSRPGPYVVILIAAETKPNGRRRWGVPGDDPEFTVDDITGRQDFTLSIPPEAFEYLGSLSSDN